MEDLFIFSLFFTDGLNIVKTVPLSLKGSDKVKHMKALMREREGISENNQVMLFAGNVLNDDQTLVDCGIQKHSTLHLVVKNPVPMKISVQIPSKGKISTLEAEACDTVFSIKSIIQAKEGIWLDTFTLVYDGHLLEDDRTLASYDLRSNSTMTLVFCQKDVLSIVVKVNDEEIKLTVKITLTVGDVKAIVASKTGISLNRWELFYCKEQLDSSRTLAFYNIKEGSRLESIHLRQIFVETWSGETLTVYVKESDSVDNIKIMVFQKLKIPVDRQRIEYAGRSLQGHSKLVSYVIQNDSTLHVVLAPSRAQ